MKQVKIDINCEEKKCGHCEYLTYRNAGKVVIVHYCDLFDLELKTKGKKLEAMRHKKCLCREIK